MINSKINNNADRQNGIEKIIEILNSDVIIIPKSILTEEDVYEESKLMFSEIFTQCLESMSTDNSLVISKAMKELMYTVPDERIQLVTACSESKAKVIRSEVLHLINHTNISKCLNERRGK